MTAHAFIGFRQPPARFGENVAAQRRRAMGRATPATVAVLAVAGLAGVLLPAPAPAPVGQTREVQMSASDLNALIEADFSALLPARKAPTLTPAPTPVPTLT
ncbi:MAG: hypothetical protein P4M15_09290 [Alphaproteobacteria bacterium]|nr:hypothetical protein [Alphaproteobacteria bacterium]